MAASHNDLKSMTDLDGNIVYVNPEDLKQKMRLINDVLLANQQAHNAEIKGHPISTSSVAGLEQKIASQAQINDQAIAQLIQQDLKQAVEVKDEKKGNNPAAANQPKHKPLPPMDDKLAQSNLQSSFFKKLPTAILGNNISSLLDLKNQSALMQTSKRARHLFQPLLTEALEPRLKQLLQHVVYGDMKQVEAIVAKNPALLLHRGRAIDYSGRTIEGTAYQMALSAEDTQMAAVLKAHLIKVTDEKTADAQYNAQFPEGWEKAEEKQWAPIFAQLDKLTHAIKDAKPDIQSSGNPEYKLTVREGSVVAKELARFRELLDDTLKETVKTGRHFNPILLLKAFQIYDDHYADYFGNDYSDPRAMLFWQRAIGSIQRLMPANYMQAFSDGLGTTEEKLRSNSPQGRSLNIEVFEGARGWVPRSVYPLSASHLGFDFAIFGAGLLGAPWGYGGPGVWSRFFEAYVNQKQQAYRAYSTPRL